MSSTKLPSRSELAALYNTDSDVRDAVDSTDANLMSLVLSEYSLRSDVEFADLAIELTKQGLAEIAA